MTDPQGVRTSRRTALKSLGLVGGAAVGLAPRWGTVGAIERPGGDGTDDEPMTTPARSAAALVATTPGLRYATLGQFSFQPNLFVNGLSVSGTGTYCSTTPGYVVTNIDLPAGAIVKTVDFFGQNSSGADASFFVERYPLTGGSSDIVADVSIPTGAAVVQSGSVAVDHVVDPTYSYDAAVLSSNTIRMFACRIGFTGPFGFRPVTPQARKLDTRLPGPLTGKFLPGQIRTLALGVPAGAAAAVVTVAVTNTTGGGFISLFPGGTAWPGTTTVNWSAAGQDIANSATVSVSTTGTVNIICDGSADAATNVVVDLVGYLT